jgi:hypothetical protein
MLDEIVRYIMNALMDNYLLEQGDGGHKVDDDEPGSVLGGGDGAVENDVKVGPKGMRDEL